MGRMRFASTPSDWTGARKSVMLCRSTVKLGVWIMNQKGRRAKLTTDKLAALAALGLNWAAS